jgi:hypothetical protein
MIDANAIRCAIANRKARYDGGMLGTRRLFTRFWFAGSVNPGDFESHERASPCRMSAIRLWVVIEREGRSVEMMIRDMFGVL